MSDLLKYTEGETGREKVKNCVCSDSYEEGGQSANKALRACRLILFLVYG